MQDKTQAKTSKQHTHDVKSLREKKERKARAQKKESSVQ
jgi:hypothetical protein